MHLFHAADDFPAVESRSAKKCRLEAGQHWFQVKHNKVIAYDVHKGHSLYITNSEVT